MDYSFKTVKEFTDFVKELEKKGKKLPFPFKRQLYTDTEIRELFRNLSKYDLKKERRLVETEPYKVRNLFNPMSDFKYLGKPTVLHFKDPEDYNNYDILSDLFQEENRLKCRRIGRKSSPLQLFLKAKISAASFSITQKDIASKALKIKVGVDGKTQDKNGKSGNITPFTVREAMWSFTSECSQFRPSTMVAMIQLFNATSVLDFSSGWGDRLLGAMAMKVNYTGIDPNDALHPVYQEMITFFNRSPKKYLMIKGGAEDPKTIIPDRKYDLIFTSPPFFDLEVFTTSKDKSQSIEKFTTAYRWYKGFLEVALSRSWKLLVPGGHLALSLNEPFKLTGSAASRSGYVRWTRQFMDSLSDSKYLGVISYVNSNKNVRRQDPQPIWIWKKKEVKKPRKKNRAKK